MKLDNYLLLLLLIAPLISLAVLAICRTISLKHYRRISLLGVTLPFSLLLYFLYETVQTGSLQHYSFTIHSRVSIFSYRYGVDSVSLWLALASSIAIIAAMLLGVYIKKRQKQFYVLTVMLQAVSFHVLFSQDGLLMCAGLLLMAFLFILLLGVWGEEERTAKRFLYFQLAGIFFISMSLILLLPLNANELESVTVTLGEFVYDDMHAMMIDPTWQAARQLSFALLLIGLLCYIPIFGLHRFLLGVYRSSHLVVSMLYSVTIGIIGVYILYRVGWTYFADLMHQIREPLIWIMGIQWLIANVNIWRQQDAKNWLGYSIWGQYSLLVILLMSATEVGLTIVWIHLLSFVLFTALIGGLLAALQERHHSLQWCDLSGSLKQTPFLAGLFVVTLAGWWGLPGLSQFLGAYHVILYSFDVSRWITLPVVAGFIAGIAYGVRIFFNLQHGQAQVRNNSVNDLRFVEAVPSMLLLSFIILLGSYPIIVVDVLEYDIHLVYRFIEQAPQVVSGSIVDMLQILDLNSRAWVLSVVICVVMSLVIWMVNYKQKNVYRMLLWQGIYHVLTLVVVIESARALNVELDMSRTIYIAIWYSLMLVGSYSMLRLVLGSSNHSVSQLVGLYHRQPLNAFVLLLFMFSLMSAPLSAGFSYQLTILELWSGSGQYGLIMLWVVGHALMATMPLEYIIGMYVSKESPYVENREVTAKTWLYVISYSSILLLVVLGFWF